MQRILPLIIQNHPKYSAYSPLAAISSYTTGYNIQLFISKRQFSNDPSANKTSLKEASKSSIDIKDGPVTFTKSPAYKDWRAMYLIEYPDTRPKIQRPVCLASVLIFAFYFFYWREENDLDEIIYQPLEKTVPEMELPVLEAAYQAHLAQNLPSDELAKKIVEVKSKQQLKQMIEEKKAK